MEPSEQTWNSVLRLAYLSSKDKSMQQRAEVLSKLIGPNTPIEHITTNTVNDIVTQLKVNGNANSTINRYLSIISRIASVYRRGFNPQYAVYIPWQKEGAGRIEWLNREDEANVQRHLVSNGLADISLCVSVLITTGMRLGELLSLEISQIEEGWVRLWQTKTNKPRSVPLPAGKADQLRALVQRGLPRGHQIRRALRDACRASGVKSRITPHSLRHTTATRLIKAGVNVITTAKYLGHNSIKTTQRYVHLEDNDITEAMKRMVT
jgi:integrase